MNRGWLSAPVALLILLFAGCGGGQSVGNPSPSPTPSSTAKPKFLYAANQVSASISGFSVDPSTGALTPLAGFPMASGVNPVFLVLDPHDKFLVSVDIAEDTLHVYAIDFATGALTEVPPSPYGVGMEPRAAAVDPSGQFLYVASQSLNSVDAFTMSASGVLTRVPGAPFATGGTTTTASFGCCVVIDPGGNFVFVADTANVYSFSINHSTGALTLVTSMPAPTGSGLAVDSTGKFLYAVGFANSIQTYAINSTTGALTLAHLSPTALGGGSFTIALDPTGHFAFTVEASEILVAYSLQNGVFSSLGGFSGALGTQQLGIDPSGSFIYAPQTGTDNDLSEFRISATGTLTPIPGSPTPLGKAPFSVVITSQ